MDACGTCAACDAWRNRLRLRQPLKFLDHYQDTIMCNNMLHQDNYGKSYYIALDWWCQCSQCVSTVLDRRVVLDLTKMCTILRMRQSVKDIITCISPHSPTAAHKCEIFFVGHPHPSSHGYQITSTAGRRGVRPTMLGSSWPPRGYIFSLSMSVPWQMWQQPSHCHLNN